MDTTQSRSPLAKVRALWRERSIFWLLVRRDLKVRYAGSALGWIWTVLDPLLMAGVYWFVFTQIFTRGVGEEPYIVFLIAGLLPWMWFTGSVSETSRALKADNKLIKSTDLPREIWVLRTVASKGIEYLLSLPVLALFAIIYKAPINWYVFTLPVAALIQVILLTGIGMILAPLVVLVPDLQRVIKIFIRLGFYASPVIYSIRNVPPGYEWVFSLNPMAGLLSLYRVGFFPGQNNWMHVGQAAGTSVVVFAVGYFVFQRLERTVLKEI